MRRLPQLRSLATRGGAVKASRAVIARRVQGWKGESPGYRRRPLRSGGQPPAHWAASQARQCLEEPGAWIAEVLGASRSGNRASRCQCRDVMSPPTKMCAARSAVAPAVRPRRPVSQPPRPQREALESPDGAPAGASCPNATGPGTSRRALSRREGASFPSRSACISPILEWRRALAGLSAGGRGRGRTRRCIRPRHSQRTLEVWRRDRVDSEESRCRHACANVDEAAAQQPRGIPALTSARAWHLGVAPGRHALGRPVDLRRLSRVAERAQRQTTGASVR